MINYIYHKLEIGFVNNFHICLDLTYTREDFGYIKTVFPLSTYYLGEVRETAFWKVCSFFLG